MMVDQGRLRPRSAHRAATVGFSFLRLPRWRYQGFCKGRPQGSFSYRFTVVVLTCRAEAEASVELFRAVLALVVADRQPVLSAPHGFVGYLFDRESSVTLALVFGADVQPPQVAVEDRVVMAWGKRGHDKADQLVVIVDKAGPCNVGHRVGVCERPGNRGDEVFLIAPQFQPASSPDIFLGYRLQPRAR
jgi:hypothetical protein